MNMKPNTLDTTINGQYVKFYATTNKTLPEVLKNTGSMVILQTVDESNQVKDNYIYVSNTMLASGYGQSTLDNKQKVDEIRESWDETLLTIDKNFTEVDNSIEALSNKVDNEMLVKTSDISNTYLKNESINTYDFLTNKNVPQYKELEVVSYKTKITYSEIHIENDEQLNSKYNDDWNSSCITVTFDKDETIELPIGVKIKNISREYIINANDDTIDTITFSIAEYNYDMLNKINSANYSINVVNNTDKSTNKDFNNVHKIKLSISKTYDLKQDNNSNNIQYMVHYGDNEIIKDIKLHSKGTTNYKNYGYVNNANISISSKDNALLERDIYLDNIIIHGKKCVLTCSDQHNIGSIYLNANRTIIHNDHQIMITMPKSSNLFYFLLPKEYEIKAAYYLTNKEKINITGNISQPLDKLYSINVYPYIYSNGNITSNTIDYTKDYYCDNYYCYYICYDENTMYKTLEDMNIILETYVRQTSNYTIYNGKLNKALYEEVLYTLPCLAVQNEEFKRTNWLNVNSNNDLMYLLDNRITYYFTINNSDIKFMNPISNFDLLSKCESYHDIIFPINISSDKKIYSILPEYYFNSIKENLKNSSILNKFNYNDKVYVESSFMIESESIIINQEKYYIGQDNKVTALNLEFFNNNFDNIETINKYYNPYNQSTEDNSLYSNKYLYICLPKHMFNDYYVIYNDNSQFNQYFNISLTVVNDNLIINDTNYVLLSSSEKLTTNLVNSNIYIQLLPNYKYYLIKNGKTEDVNNYININEEFITNNIDKFNFITKNDTQLRLSDNTTYSLIISTNLKNVNPKIYYIDGVQWKYSFNNYVEIANTQFYKIDNITNTDNNSVTLHIELNQ